MTGLTLFKSVCYVWVYCRLLRLLPAFIYLRYKHSPNLLYLTVLANDINMFIFSKLNLNQI